MLLKYDLGQTLPLGAGWSARLSATGRSWISGAGRLGSGDEWYLGGADALRGYGDRQIAAAAGAWATLEIQHRLGASSVASIFAEGASLRGLDGSAAGPRSRLPYGYGCALWLLSADRIARLEFAWRDHAAWRDGLVRLRISQSW
jgi:hemolysin activation/secretion protein